MDPQMSSALSLLGIGMITVFLVLLLVVLTGNLLIAVVNQLNLNTPNNPNGDEISEEEIAVIQAAVEVVTKGKGSITKIEKR